ncbi:hypothetical protein MKW92_000722 [Papaver armeniacum]|nr:hypothetical protein MKW92_000722 [Papaver armeniacum]
MDRRSWPWKKKSSEKAADKASEKSADKKQNYVQISVESYTMNDQVTTLDEEVQALKEEVSGKRLKPEAVNLKTQLESVMALLMPKSTSHLDGAPQCMRQIRMLRMNMTRNCTGYSQQNNCVSMLMKISEEKSQAEAEIELLKENLCHVKGDYTLKYEKNMSVKSAEVADKQYLEGVEKWQVRRRVSKVAWVLLQKYMCKKTASKLEPRITNAGVCLEEELLKSNAETSLGGFSTHNTSNPPSLTSMSEDGIDEEGVLQSLGEKCRYDNKTESANQLELMDDFLEMQRLVCIPADSNCSPLKSASPGSSNHVSLSEELPEVKLASNDGDVGKILEDIKVLYRIYNCLCHNILYLCLDKAMAANVGGNQVWPEDKSDWPRMCFFGSKYWQRSEINGTPTDEQGIKKKFCQEISLDNLVPRLSPFMFWQKARETHEETNTSDCVDKIALSEKKIVQDDSVRENFANGFQALILNITASKVVIEEFLTNEIRSRHTKSQLQLASFRESYSLAETQLKCMAEAYKSLENVHMIWSFTEEKQSHQDALAKCSSLQEQIERNDRCSRCESSAVDEKDKAKQEREITAAAENLQNVRKPYFLLGKQLKSMHFLDEVTSPRSLEPNSMFSSQDFDSNSLIPTKSVGCLVCIRDRFKPYSRSPVSRPKHRSTRSSSSSSSSLPTPEKQPRSFSRFFFN